MNQSKHVTNFMANHALQGETVKAWTDGYTGKAFGQGDDKQQNGVLIITEKRVIFYRKGLLGEIIETIDIAKITSVERKSTMGSRSIRLHTSHDDLKFTTINKQGEIDIVNAIAIGRGEEPLSKVGDNNKVAGAGNIVKKIFGGAFVFSLVIIFMILLTDSDKDIVEPMAKPTANEESICSGLTQEMVDNISSEFNSSLKNPTLIQETASIILSDDFTNVYFIAAEIHENGEFYGIGIWTIVLDQTMENGDWFSINSYATENTDLKYSGNHALGSKSKTFDDTFEWKKNAKKTAPSSLHHGALESVSCVEAEIKLQKSIVHKQPEKKVNEPEKLVGKDLASDVCINNGICVRGDKKIEIVNKCFDMHFKGFENKLEAVVFDHDFIVRKLDGNIENLPGEVFLIELLGDYPMDCLFKPNNELITLYPPMRAYQTEKNMAFFNRVKAEL